jgi:hemolysin III
VRPVPAGPSAANTVGGVTTERAGPLERPRYRGVIHRWAALIGVPAFAILIAAAPAGPARAAVAIHAVGVVTMLAVSAVYHSGRCSPRAVAWFKRLDHATILLAIAGSYVGTTVLALEGAAQSRMLWIVAIGTAAGIAIRMTWLHAPYPVAAAVYVVVGWSALADLPAYVRGTTAGELALVVAGGVLYTVAGGVYALHRPNLWPASFGYHELFHALVVAGAACHYASVAMLLGR